MKPLGRKYFKWQRKTDCHPKKGYINWWEDVCTPLKSRERRRVQRQIESELQDMGDLKFDENGVPE